MNPPPPSGFTLVEVAVGLGVGSLVLIALILLITRGYRIPREQFEQARITEDARSEINRIAQAIRNGRAVDLDGDGVAESGPVVEGGLNHLQLFTNVDSDQTPELVRYTLEGTDLQRGVIEATSAGQYLEEDEEVHTRLRSIRNLTTGQSLFTFFTNPQGIISRVGIAVVVDYNPNELPPAATVQIDPVLIRVNPQSGATTAPVIMPSPSSTIVGSPSPSSSP